MIRNNLPDPTAFRNLDFSLVDLAAAHAKDDASTTKTERANAGATVAKLENQRENVAAKIAARDERIAEARRRAEADRQDVVKLCDDLVAFYADPNELLKHARIVALAEIDENEYNLNIPRYVDTFEPEPRLEAKDALKAPDDSKAWVGKAEAELTKLLGTIGYAGTDTH